MAARVVGVIPARMDSKRFYGKILYNYQGRPLLYYLFAELSKSKVMNQLIIATDSSQVQRAASLFGAEVVMTSKNIRTGSDRVAAVMKRVKGDIFVNVQGDVFGLKHAVLDKALKKFLNNSSWEYGTLARKIDSDQEALDPDAVKVVLKENGDAGWFSRYPLPFLRHPDKRDRTKQASFYYHIGVYMFRKRALEQYARWKSTPHEKAESLEQLRILENGRNIRVFTTNMKTVSVDSPKDLIKLKDVLN